MHTAIDFKSYKGKMVDLTRKSPDGEPVVEQGRVIEGNELGLIFKRRSQRTSDLVEASDVLHIESVETARLQSIGRKNLRPPTLQSVRRHLVDFHALKISEVENLGPEAAMRMHDEIDHSDLGHTHDSTSAGRETSTRVDAEKDEVLDRISRLRRSA